MQANFKDLTTIRKNSPEKEQNFEEYRHKILDSHFECTIHHETENKTLRYRTTLKILIKEAHEIK